jgi:hypothetical protein
MPSQYQSGQADDYPSEAERHVCEWSNKMLLRLRPMTKELAQDYLAACNKHSVDREIKTHFYQQIQRLKG